MIRWIPTLAALLLSPAPALACAACAAAVEKNRTAFLGTTLLLSLLPLGLIGAGLWWIARNSREPLAREFEERDSLPATRPPAPAEAAARAGEGPLLGRP